jgi:hypothetical protein
MLNGHKIPELENKGKSTKKKKKSEPRNQWRLEREI